MDTQRINIFDKAYCDHISFRIADNFQFQFFPAENGFFHQNLTDQRSLQATGTNGFQFFYVINQTAAGTTHSISRAQNNRIAQFIGNCQSFIYRIGNLASCHFDPQTVHCFLEFDTVFTAFNGVHLHTNDLYIIFFQNACFCQFRTQIQTGLTPQIGKQSIRSFLCNNLFQSIYIQRFDISHICNFRVCHDGCRVGIYQNDFITEITQSFACLSAGIVKFTGLTNDNGTGTDNQYFFHIFLLFHESSSLLRKR